MNLDKAIENRTAFIKKGKTAESTEDYNATLLSIEALKRCRYADRTTFDGKINLLPGETED